MKFYSSEGKTQRRRVGSSVAVQFSSDDKLCHCALHVFILHVWRGHITLLTYENISCGIHAQAESGGVTHHLASEKSPSLHMNHQGCVSSSGLAYVHVNSGNQKKAAAYSSLFVVYCTEKGACGRKTVGAHSAVCNPAGVKGAQIL